jgi:hypothetical protein
VKEWIIDSDNSLPALIAGGELDYLFKVPSLAGGRSKPTLTLIVLVLFSAEPALAGWRCLLWRDWVGMFWWESSGDGCSHFVSCRLASVLCVRVQHHPESEPQLYTLSPAPVIPSPSHTHPYPSLSPSAPPNLSPSPLIPIPISHPQFYPQP